MRYIKNMRTKFVAAVVGVIVMGIVASWQFSLSVMFRNPQGHLDPQGGRYHLWLAVGAAVMACLAGGSMFLLFLHHDKNKRSTASMPLLEPPLALPNINAPIPAPFDAIYWDQLNEWHLEGQADDRRPTLGSVGESTGSSSARRSVARLSHQVMYKEWSKERHD